MPKVKIILASILLFSIFIPPLHAEQTLVLNTPGHPPSHYPDQSGTIDQLMEEAFGRIDVQVTLKSLPPEEALINANNGIKQS